MGPLTASGGALKGRESELQSTPGHSIDGLYESDAGSKLMEPRQGWLSHEAKLRRAHLSLRCSAGGRRLNSILECQKRP